MSGGTKGDHHRNKHTILWLNYINLTEHFWWRWLYVERLWLAESLRGQGYAQRLLKMAEIHALAGGCSTAFADTFDPRVLAFLEHHGYEVPFTLDDFPPGQRQYFLKKTLLPPIMSAK